MATLNFPDIVPDSAEWTITYNTQVFESDLNGAIQTAELPGARWSASLTFSNRQGRDARELRAFLAQLKGRAGRFWLTPSDWEPLGTADGIPQVSVAASAGATSVSTTGWTAEQPEALLAGDHIEINGELKIVTATVAADINGDATIQFAPPARTDFTVGMEVETSEPRALMALADDDQAAWNIGAPIIYAITINCREPLDV